MMNPLLKIGTRQSQLAVWQATHVQHLLQKNNVHSELVFIKSEGDMNTTTPLYELGVQGIFTRMLDSALLNNKIDIAVHSMKDVPTQLAAGVRQAAVLKRDSFRDTLVFKGSLSEIDRELGFANGQWIEHSTLPVQHSPLTIATSSTRRKAQWLHRYPHHRIENLRGNVNTRLQKLNEQNWTGAIFAAAGLERINLRPENSIDLDWMLPAPAQGAITISCRSDDDYSYKKCHFLNNTEAEQCTREERNFLRALLGGCSTPISALAVIENNQMIFKGNICSTDGKQKFDIEKIVPLKNSAGIGLRAANELLENEEVKQILLDIRHGNK